MRFYVFCIAMLLCSSLPFFSIAAVHGNDESVSIYFDGAEPGYYPDFEPLPSFIKYQVPTDYRKLYGAIGKTKKCILTHIGSGIAIGAGHCHLAKIDTVQWGYLGGLVDEQHLQKKRHLFHFTNIQSTCVAVNGNS